LSNIIITIVTIVIIIIIITIIIITIRHQLDLDRPVTASYNSPFRGLPRRLRPFDVQFSIIFGILLLFIVVHMPWPF
jgi:NADH:ubiquinone oxidoreductase subunit 3 (subunit A)